MPALAELLARRAGIAMVTAQDAAQGLLEDIPRLEKRVYIPCCDSTSPQGLVEAMTVDPWTKAGKYALGWVYFAIILLVITTALRWYHYFFDKVRIAVHKENQEQASAEWSPYVDYEMATLHTKQSSQELVPKDVPGPDAPEDLGVPTFRPMNILIALFRLVFYHPLPALRVKNGWRPILFPSLGALALVFAALTFVVLYCFVPQPLYWQSIRFGSPPLAIRAGMLAVAMMPWIVALSMKANFISWMTGLGHERLNVLHRWLAYLFLLLSLIHTIPFYIAPVNDDGALQVFQQYFNNQHIYIYGTGVAALVPILFLSVHSLPPLRRRFYEVFRTVHVPVAILLLAMLFWHCHRYLTSWNYLFATLAIWLLSYFARVCYLNWARPWRMSWLIGEESALTLLTEDAIKITIPTQMRWRPGQYVYLRMPGIAVFENHPFTIASLCSDDFPSEYGEEYRDMVLVFRPFKGFTKKVLEAALEHGPWHTYRAFLDGPYGGMRRNVESFDHVVMVAGGSGITSIVSSLLDLIKRMREGRAVTKSVQLIWAMKRPDIIEWFKEELRICREYAPPDSVSCHFYITSAVRNSINHNAITSLPAPARPSNAILHDRVNDIFQNIASNRYSTNSQRNSAIIEDEAHGDPEREKELRDENADRPRPLPEAHLKAIGGSSAERRPSPSPEGRARMGDHLTVETPHMPPHPSLHEKRRSRPISIDLSDAQQRAEEQIQMAEEAAAATNETSAHGFDFGFPSTPTEFQKNLMRFAFMPAAVQSRKTGWSTEWGRPDIPYLLQDMSADWKGKRTCVLVCGPPSMRMDVSRTVARMQRLVLKDKEKEEIYLHTENYSL